MLWRAAAVLLLVGEAVFSQVKGNPVLETDAQVLTNKAIDAEATGNVITNPVLVEYRHAICQNTTASLGLNTWTSNEPTAVCVTGTNTQYAVAQYADADGEYELQGRFMLPDDWDAGTIDWEIFWRLNTTTGNIVWQLETICVGDGETGDPAFNTAQTVTDTAKGTANQFNEATISSVTTTGCAAGEYFYWRHYRQRTHASDTIGAFTPESISSRFKLRRAM